MGRSGEDVVLRGLLGLPLCVASFPASLSIRQEQADREDIPRAGYWPSLIILLPNVVLVSILLATYQAKKATGQAPESQEGPTPLAREPPSEGSVDYLANLVRPAQRLYEIEEGRG